MSVCMLLHVALAIALCASPASSYEARSRRGAVPRGGLRSRRARGGVADHEGSEVAGRDDVPVRVGGREADTGAGGGGGIGVGAGVAGADAGCDPAGNPWVTKHYDGTQCGFCSFEDKARVSIPKDIVSYVDGHTLVSRSRRECTIDLAICTVLEGIEGDFVETGVFRGGTAILMKRVIDACVDGKPPKTTIPIWLADSFDGLPAPQGRIDRKFTRKGTGLRSRTSPDKIRRGNYRASYDIFTADYGKMAFFDQARGQAFADGERSEVKIIKGWFNESLPTAPVEKISFLRLDGDVYSSTWDGLVNLYPKVVEGGYVYLDDYGSFAGCQRATDQYRAKYNLTEPMHEVGEGVDKIPPEKVAEGVQWPAEAVWWKKGSAV